MDDGQTDTQRLKEFKETHLASNPRHIYIELDPEQCWTCFLVSRLEGALPAAAKWWQVYQDRCEGAYMEVTLHKERVKELQEAISHRNERITELQQEVSTLRNRFLLQLDEEQINAALQEFKAELHDELIMRDYCQDQSCHCRLIGRDIDRRVQALKIP